MRPSRLSEYLLRRDDDGHGSGKSQGREEMKMKSAYYEDQLECPITLG